MAMLALEAGRGFVGNHPDFLKKTLAGVALVLAGPGLGFVHAVRGEVQDTVAITGGVGTLDPPYVMDPKECHGGYDALITGSRAEMKREFRGLPLARASETFTGKVSNIVCNTGVAGTQLVDKNTGHVTIKLPENAFSTFVFQTYPADPNAFVSDNGFSIAGYKALANYVKALPGGVDVKGPDQFASSFRGYALLAAYETSTRACGVKAWPYLKPIIRDEIVKQEVANANKYNSDKPKTAADFTVELPSDIMLESQYDKQLDAMTGELAAAGVTIQRPDPSELKCEESNAMRRGGS